MEHVKATLLGLSLFLTAGVLITLIALLFLLPTWAFVPVIFSPLLIFLSWAIGTDIRSHW